MFFYIFLDNCDIDSYLLRKHPNFLYIGEPLKKEHYKNNISLLTKFCLVPTVLFFKLDTNIMADIIITNIMADIIITNNIYNHTLQNIEKQIVNLENYQTKEEFQILKDKKEELFQSYCENTFFSEQLFISTVL